MSYRLRIQFGFGGSLLVLLVATVLLRLQLPVLAQVSGEYRLQSGGVELAITPTKIWDVSVTRQTIALRGTGGFTGTVTVTLAGGGVSWRCDSECNPGLGSGSYMGVSTTSYDVPVVDGQWRSFSPELIGLPSPLPEESAATTSLTVTASGSGITSVSKSATVRSEPSLSAADVNCAITSGTQPFSPSNKQTVAAGQSVSYSCALQVGGFTGAWTSPTAVTLSVNESFSDSGVTSSFSPNPASISVGSQTSVTFTTSAGSSATAGVYSYTFGIDGPDGYRSAFVPAILTVEAPASSSSSSGSSSSGSSSSSSTSQPSSSSSGSSSSQDAAATPSSESSSSEAASSSSTATAGETASSSQSKKTAKKAATPVAQVQTTETPTVPLGALEVPTVSPGVLRTVTISGTVTSGAKTPVVGAEVVLGDSRAITGKSGGYLVTLRSGVSKAEELPGSAELRVTHPSYEAVTQSVELPLAAGATDLDQSVELRRKADAQSLSVSVERPEVGTTIQAMLSHFPADSRVQLLWSPRLVATGSAGSDTVPVTYRSSVATIIEAQVDASGGGATELTVPSVPGSYVLVATNQPDFTVSPQVFASAQSGYVATDRSDAMFITVVASSQASGKSLAADAVATNLFAKPVAELVGSERRQLGSLLAPLPKPIERQTPFGAPTVTAGTSSLRLDGCEPPTCTIKTDPSQPVQAVPSWRVIPGAYFTLTTLGADGASLGEEKYDSQASFPSPAIISDRLRAFTKAKIESGAKVELSVEGPFDDSRQELTTEVLASDLYDRYLKSIFHEVYTINGREYDEEELNQQRSAIYAQLYTSAQTITDKRSDLEEIFAQMSRTDYWLPYRGETVLGVSSSRDSADSHASFDQAVSEVFGGPLAFLQTSAYVYTDLTTQTPPWRRAELCHGTLGGCLIVGEHRFAISFAPFEQVAYLGSDIRGMIEHDYVDSASGETKRVTIADHQAYYKSLTDPEGVQPMIEAYYRKLHDERIQAAQDQVAVASQAIRESVSQAEILLGMSGLRQWGDAVGISSALEFALTSSESATTFAPESTPRSGIESVISQLVTSASAADATEGTLRPTNYLRIRHTGAAANLLLTDPLGRSYGISPLTGELVDQLTGTVYSGAGTGSGELFVPGIVEGVYRFSLKSEAEGDATVSIERAIGVLDPETSSATIHLVANKAAGGEISIELDTKATGSVAVDVLRYLTLSIHWYWWLLMVVLGVGLVVYHQYRRRQALA